MLAIGCNRQVATARGTMRADDLAAKLPRAAWARHSAGAGSKGQRWYSWARVELNEPSTGHRWALFRRNDATGELAYYRCYSPTPVRLADRAGVAGQRWKVEEAFQASKGLTGLDEHQVRRWTSWHRWVTLAMLAHAFLAITTTAERSTRTTTPDLRL